MMEQHIAQLQILIDEMRATLLSAKSIAVSTAITTSAASTAAAAAATAAAAAATSSSEQNEQLRSIIIELRAIVAPKE